MKKLLSLFVFVSSVAFSQDYTPFNQDVPKRFFEVGDAGANDFYFYSYKEDVLADGIKFYQYFRRTETEVLFDSEDCGGWGTDFGLGADTTWLGREIVFTTSSKTLLLKNELDEPLVFDFSLALGDSALFYSDVANEFYIKHTSNAPEVIYGITDNVKIFTVFHYDIDGVAVPSALHEFEIKLGETLGLLSFINCNHFPLEEKAYTLMGQLHPTIGKYQMTFDEAFPWEIGDVLQYESIYNNPEVWVNNRTYKTMTIIDRVETVDSVFIYHTSEDFTLYNPVVDPFPIIANFSYPNPISFKKGNNISEDPSKMMPYTNSYQLTDSADYCGSREQLRIMPDWLGYCDSCQCDIFQDGFGTDLIDQTYLTGLGMTATHTQSYGGPGLPSTTTNLMYSRINGVECGSEIFAGIKSFAVEYQLYPNPAVDQLTIILKKPINQIRILDLNGALIFESFSNGSTKIDLDVANFPTGLYLIEFVSDEASSYGRFVKN